MVWTRRSIFCARRIWIAEMSSSFPPPTYSMYEIYGSCTDGIVKTVPSAADFAFPLEPLLAAITPETRADRR